MDIAANLTYPAFAFVFGGRSVVIAPDRRLFGEATPSQLRSGFFNTPFDVVDSLLSRWVIQHVAPSRKRVLTSLLDTVTNKPVKIAVEGVRCEDLSFESLKAKLARAIMDDPTGVWTGREESPEELVDLVQKAGDVRDLLAALAWPAGTAS